MVAERSTGSVLKLSNQSKDHQRAAMDRAGTPGSDRDGRALREQLDDAELIEVITDHEQDDGAGITKCLSSSANSRKSVGFSQARTGTERQSIRATRLRLP